MNEMCYVRNRCTAVSCIITFRKSKVRLYITKDQHYLNVIIHVVVVELAYGDDLVKTSS